MEQLPPIIPLVIYAIGHSTLPIHEFVRKLTCQGVNRLVDIRTVPRSKHNPQYNQSELSAVLQSVHIHYTHMPGLGGFRHPRPDSLNIGWRNSSFRGYADYMQTPEFQRNLNDLIERAKQETAAVMCAEAVPWRCHRSLIADALLARGIEVREIIRGTQTRTYRLTPFARLNGIVVTYPAATSERKTG